MKLNEAQSTAQVVFYALEQQLAKTRQRLRTDSRARSQEDRSKPQPLAKSHRSGSCRACRRGVNVETASWCQGSLSGSSHEWKLLVKSAKSFESGQVACASSR